MPTAKVSSDIKAPLEQVFELFTDIENAAERVVAIKEIRVTSTGPMNLGTRWIETREVLGRIDEAEMEITSFVRNRNYTITHRKGGVRIDTAFTFEPTADGTRVSVEFDLNSQGLPPGLLSPLEWAIGGKVEEALGADLSDLKGSVERVVG